MTEPEVFRADGGCLCSCGQFYRDHPITRGVSWSGAAEDDPVLRRLCDGTLVKL